MAFKEGEGEGKERKLTFLRVEEQSESLSQSVNKQHLLYARPCS